jgi:hypothetical protein
MSWLVELLGLLLGFLTISAINDWIQKYCPRITTKFLNILTISIVVLLFLLQRYTSTQQDQQLTAIQHQSTAANARAERAETTLAQFRAPRTLSTAQQAQIADAVRDFAGTPFDIAIVAYEPEIIALVDVLETALTQAGWRPQEWSGLTGMVVLREKAKVALGIAAVDNIVIQLYPDDSATFSPAAHALATALTHAGLEAQTKLESPPTEWNREALHLLIGRKR